MSLERIRADWTRLGEHDPMWAVLVSPAHRHRGWSPSDFFATGRCDFVLDDGRGLTGYPDASFDICYSSLVLKHIAPPDNQRVLGELGRLLRPGGVLYVHVASRPTRSAKGWLFAHAPRSALRAAQRHVLRYPAPMEMHPLDRTAVESVVAAAGGRVHAVEDDDMYGGDWVYTRYFVHKARRALDGAR